MVILIVDNAVTMFTEIGTEVLSLFVFAVLKQSNGGIDIAFPQASSRLTRSVALTPRPSQDSRSGDTNRVSLAAACQQPSA